MAKCGICKSKKGKRLCIRVEKDICSLCCGQTRNKDKCIGCVFFKDTESIRDYKKVPSFTVRQMSSNTDLEDWSYSIEGAICKLDYDMDNGLNDKIAIRIIELLIDKYHFGDVDFNFDNITIEKGFKCVDEVIREDLANIEKEIIVKLLGVIRFVANRRTNGGREYMEIIHQYVGARVGPGARIMRK